MTARWLWALTLAAWAWMLGQAALAHRLSCCAPHPGAAEAYGGWLAMVVAMMVPTVIGAASSVAARSYRARRARAVIGYVMGYLAPWAALGLAVVALRVSGARVATAFATLAAAWLLLPRRARWFRQCHRQIALCPVGARADLDCARQGWINGAPCVAMCAPLMIACQATGHELVVMIACTALAIYEKRMFRLRRAPLVLGALAIAAWTLLRW